MTNIIIVGYKGRMGQTLLNAVASSSDLQLAGKVDEGDDIQPAIARADVVVDFSFHEVTADVAELCAQHEKALVIGTTGHTDVERAHITKASSRIPVVWASNYSTGVNALFWLTRRAAEILGESFDLEI